MQDFKTEPTATYYTEGELYQRIAGLEAELATSRKYIERLEKSSDYYESKINVLFKLFFFALVALTLAMVLMILLGVYLINH